MKITNETLLKVITLKGAVNCADFEQTKFKQPIARTHNTGLAKLAVQCSADTFVVKIAAFLKPETVSSIDVILVITKLRRTVNQLDKNMEGQGGQRRKMGHQTYFICHKINT